MSPLAYLTTAALLWSGQAEHFVALDANLPPRKQAAVGLSEVDEDFAFQGEYLGSVRAVCGTIVPFGLQVAALGKGEFSALGFQDGLPGNGWDRATMISWNGSRQGAVLIFDGPRGRITIKDRGGQVVDSSGVEVGQIRKVRRRSTTLGATPPAGALVLFDGTSTEAFEKGKLSPDGWLDVGAITRMAVKDFRLHLEFRSPYMPGARGQGRANSGVYIQRRYEVQILDSFGLVPVFNGCGALYRQQIPDLNMTFPPLAWQTYDIYFTAARWDEESKSKIADARITVFHNGVAIHNDRAIPTKTGAGKPETPEDGPILLQDHGNPVRFRNVWLVTGAELPAVSTATAQASQLMEPRSEGCVTCGILTDTTIAGSCTACDSDGYGWDTATYALDGGSAACSVAVGSGRATGGWILWKGKQP